MQRCSLLESIKLAANKGIQVIDNQALQNALSSDSTMNYEAIFLGFIEKGIAEDEIKPRENIFTYRAWHELGRQVRKGETGVKIVTYVPMTKKGEEGEFRRPKGTTVFHISQTDSIDASNEGAKPEIPATSIAKTQPKPKAPSGDKLRALADKMQAMIDDKLSDRLTNTAKRLAQASHARLDGERLQRAQKALYAMADLSDASNLPEILEGIKSKKAVLELVGTELTPVNNGYHGYSVCTGQPNNNSPEAVAIWDLLGSESEEEKQAKALRAKISGLLFTKIPGYFPTPKAVIAMMIDHADIQEGDRVLEPNLGHGAIADEVAPLCKEVKGFEVNHTLAEICDLKDYLIECRDFLAVEWEEITSYEKILMNPPFEKMQDADHVRHAFGFLKPGGRLVSIMSPSAFQNSTQKAEDFRWWFDMMGGERYDLPAGSFKESGTGVNTILIVINN